VEPFVELNLQRADGDFFFALFALFAELVFAFVCFAPCDKFAGHLFFAVVAGPFRVVLRVHRQMAVALPWLRSFVSLRLVWRDFVSLLDVVSVHCSM
jgi:hypothetical protein